MPSAEEKTWKEIVAEIVRNVFSVRMAWVLIGAAAIGILYAIVDAAFFNGCINFGFFQSSNCPEQKAITTGVESEKSNQVFPSGAILISTKACENFGDEWAEYKEGAGKFILGAGSGVLRFRGPHTPANSPPSVLLTRVDFGDEGGEEVHFLASGEIPQHQHTVHAVLLSEYYGPTAALGLERPATATGDILMRPGRQQKEPTQKTYNSGGFENPTPGNNMPPFIALYYCLKK